VSQWDRFSDRFGQKPPPLFGTLGLTAAIIFFGVSKAFWALILSRCIQGVFNGNIGITKAIMAEIADASNTSGHFGTKAMRVMIQVPSFPKTNSSENRPRYCNDRLALC
jgi:MFS family permease